MKTFSRLLSLTVVGCSLMAFSPAHADSEYHPVYHQYIAADDSFSILDKYQNNVLTAEEYNNGNLVVPFHEVDANKDGFISRAEFYSYYRPAKTVAMYGTHPDMVMPAAGGNDDLNSDVQ